MHIQIDDRLETYDNLPSIKLEFGESPYESPFSIGEPSGYELPSPLNTQTESAGITEVHYIMLIGVAIYSLHKPCLPIV